MKKNRTKACVILTIAVILLLLTLACGFAFGLETENTFETQMYYDISDAVITVTPQAMIYTGETLAPTVTVQMNGVILKEGTDYALSIPEMENVDTYYVGVAGKGNYTGIVTVECYVSPINLKKASLYVTRELTTADLSDDDKSISDSVISSLIKVEQDGVDVSSLCSYSFVVAGNQVKITAYIEDSDNPNLIKSSVSKIFLMKTSITDCSVGILETYHVYSGDPILPAVKAYDLYNPSLMKEGEDYELDYSNNINAGYAYITATGIGDYTGVVTLYFEIRPKDIFHCITFYRDGRSSKAYTAHEWHPLVTVRDGGKKMLLQDKDYIVKYVNEKNKEISAIKDVGFYTVNAIGIGNYTGAASLTFEIIGTDISDYTVNLRHDRVKADGNVKVPKISSVKLEGTSVLTSNEYDVSYRDENGKKIPEMVTPGIYTIEVAGKNGFCGTASARFEIIGAEQQIKLNKTAYKVYKGTPNFTLEPKATGDGTGFTYVSSNPDVATVSDTGEVNIHKLGRAEIIITTAGDTLYAPKSKSVYVKVHPYKGVLTQKPWTDGLKKTFKVRWETQEDVTYYQVRYSTRKDFKTYKIKKVNQNTKGYKTQSTSVKNLKSGQRYYIQVRAVKTVKNDYGETLYYYGNWSPWRSVVTK